MKIYDRFFLDFKVSWDFLGLNYNEEVFEKLPKAKNYFLLVAPPKVLYERKPEHTLEFFEKCYEQYLILAKQYGIVVIDTDKKSEEEVENFIINKLIS